jgi:hypothetical protein
LQNRGTKVKILGDDDEPTKQTPKQRSGGKKEDIADIHNLVDSKPDPANKENAPVGACQIPH